MNIINITCIIIFVIVIFLFNDKIYELKNKILNNLINDDINNKLLNYLNALILPDIEIFYYNKNKINLQLDESISNNLLIHINNLINKKSFKFKSMKLLNKPCYNITKYGKCVKELIIKCDIEFINKNKTKTKIGTKFLNISLFILNESDYLKSNIILTNIKIDDYYIDNTYINYETNNTNSNSNDIDIDIDSIIPNSITLTE